MVSPPAHTHVGLISYSCASLMYSPLDDSWNTPYACPLSSIAICASGIYLVDVRPKIKSLNSGSRQGPYGPW